MGGLVKLFTGVSIYVWLALAGTVGVGLAVWKAYDMGYSRASAAWEAKALDAQIQKLERELRTAKDAADQEEQARLALDEDKAKLETELSNYVHTVEARLDRCPLSDDDIKQLH